MKSIVNQHGRPFKPGIGEMLQQTMSWFQAPKIIGEPCPPEPATTFDILALRQSCGVAPETIVFRRPRLEMG